ncbi:hypothetical protein GvMRE_Ic2g9 [endosymbiont GvMRE of Glomus versiforme]|nr:hypothetical protein GvMRE_Ic2g9 [endosymbiont GvMRE of Glomus versiforme]
MDRVGRMRELEGWCIIKKGEWEGRESGCFC